MIIYKIQLYERPADGTTDISFFTREWGQDVYRYDGRLVLLTQRANDLVRRICARDPEEVLIERKTKKKAATDDLPPLAAVDDEDSHREEIGMPGC